MKKSKLKKKLAKAKAAVATRDEWLAERNLVWDEYDEFQRWLRDHAPATVRRYEDIKALPRYRPQSLDEILRYYYTPALRAQLNDSLPIFGELNGLADFVDPENMEPFVITDTPAWARD